MEDYKKKLLKEAEELRKKALFPFCLFSSPDYESSAEKFKEASSLCSDRTEKIKYLIESANTYLMNPVEYSRYNCYLIYSDIADLYVSFDIKEAIIYFEKAGDMALSCNKENLAANCFEKASAYYYEENNINESIRMMEKVTDCYNNSSWKYHYMNSLKKLSFLLFKNKDFEKAAKNLLKLNKNIYNLCAGLCYYLQGVHSDLDIEGEESIIYKSLDKGADDVNIAIEKYLDNNAVEKEVRDLLDFVVDRLKPENDIL